MDRNSVTGFILLAVMLIGYFSYNNYSQNKFLEQKRADSIAYAKAHPVAPLPKPAAVLDTTLHDSTALAAQVEVKEIVVENKDLKLTFSTKGAILKSALLKNYKTYSGKPLLLFNGDGNELSIALPKDGHTEASKDMYFTAASNGTQSATFVTDMGNGRTLQYTYTLPTEGFMLQCDVKVNGVAMNTLPINWSVTSLHTERDVQSERQNAQIHFKYKDGDHDYWTVKPDGVHETPQQSNIHWAGLRMHYFSTALIADNGFTKADLTAKIGKDTNTVASTAYTMELPLTNGAASMRWFIGPNQYQMLKNYNIGMDEFVPLGAGIFFFVKYINQWLIIPVFELLKGFVTNYGLIIILMTLFIKLLLSFFTYKSYLSSAKMRVLKPELDELRAKYGEDQQRMSMEQMKLYRTAGVSPLGGCLPTLFMMPFLVAMYYFFPAAIDFRQQSFLWANDLSTYDSIASLPFSFFDHISLFTLLMTISSLFLALYNRNMTPQDPNNPMMKWMPFIFPIILLGVFNKMAAALTCYYFFSNVVSILQQFIIQKGFINEEKIHAQLKENRNKPVAASKWQQRLEDMQKANADRMKNTQGKK